MPDTTASGAPPVKRSPARPGLLRLRRRGYPLVAGLALFGLASVVPVASADAAPGLMRAPLESASISGLRQGSSGPQVASLQRALMSAGITVPGGADGVYGPATRAAVAEFQEQQGLPSTGEVDQTTANSLAAASGGSNTGGGSDGGDAGRYVGLEQGATGDAVKDVQRALMDVGVYVPGGADGVYGAATTTAVRQFQRWNGLEATGTVTAGTARLLGLSGGGTPGGGSGGGGGTAPSPDPEPNVDAAYVGLRLGASGPLVRELQQALLDADVKVPGGADGAFGPATEGALKAFQWRSERAQTGVVTEADAIALGLGSGGGPVGAANPGSDAATDAPNSSNPYVGLAQGDEGPLVTEVQKALQGFGFVIRGGANGVFGPSTTSTLKAFQSVNGIAKTGVVTEKGASIMKLGSESGEQGSGGSGDASDGGQVTLRRFPVQGRCFFGDTWHAPRSNNRVHEGVDIIAEEGKLLYAVVDGEITKQYWDYPGALAGNGLRLRQADGTYFTYLHLLDFAPGIEVGTEVQAGDVIGFVGNTGSSATAHLHFEIHPQGGEAINPYPYVKAIDDCDNTTPQYQQSYPGPAPADVTEADAATAEVGISD